jgi:hypothetical protein
LVFLVAGAAIGVAVGRGLARTLSDWADDAPVASGDELPATVDDQPSLPSVVLLCLVAVTSVYVPIQYHVPTPIPGGLAAIAVQAWLQGRAIEKVQRRRGGRVLRPGGRLSFDGAELRLLPETARESGSPQG